MVLVVLAILLAKAARRWLTQFVRSNRGCVVACKQVVLKSLAQWPSSIRPVHVKLVLWQDQNSAQTLSFIQCCQRITPFAQAGANTAEAVIDVIGPRFRNHTNRDGELLGLFGQAGIQSKHLFMENKKSRRSRSKLLP